MQTCRAIERLDQHQAVLLAHMDEAVALLRLGPVAGPPPLAQARWKMVRLLREYQAFKHVEIFDPVIRTGSPHRAALARELRAKCVAAGDAYRDYTLRWSSTDIAGHWEAYQPAMLEMVSRGRAHLMRERDQVRALLSGAPRTRVADVR